MTDLQRYTSGKITSVFPIKRMTWMDWQRKGWTPEVKRKGRGRHYYTLRDLWQVEAMLEMSRKGIETGLAAELAKYVAQACEAVLAHGLQHGHPKKPAWIALQRAEDGRIARFAPDCLEQVDVFAVGGSMVILIDCAQVVVSTFQRLVDHDDEQRRQKGEPMICTECRAARKPSDKLYYCPHRQTLSVAEYSEHGSLERYGYIAGVTGDQVQEAVRRIEQAEPKQ